MTTNNNNNNKKIVIITGGNSGLGYECAKNILKQDGYFVILACRSQSRAENAIAELIKETKNENITFMPLDLNSLDSVRAFKENFEQSPYKSIYSLVCNAGINPANVEYTKDGFESTFGVNHLAHFLLSNLLLPYIAENGRIIFVSSDTHEPPKFFPFPAPVFEEIEPLAHPTQEMLTNKTTMMLRYPTSKLCNLLCAYQLADRLQKDSNKNITVNAFNPGLMTNTNFNGDHNLLTSFLLKSIMTLLGFAIGRLGNRISSGRELALMVTDDKYNRQTKKYIDRGREVNSSPASYDKKAAQKLWIQSSELVNLSEYDTILEI